MSDADLALAILLAEARLRAALRRARRTSPVDVIETCVADCARLGSL